MNGPALGPILVVDDSDDDFEAIERAFRRSGGVTQPIRHFDNGGDALDYVFRRGRFAPPVAAPRPTLVLLDLNMPGIDGRAVLTQIKSSKDTAGIPVVVLTTSESSRDINACYGLGANTYIRKPVTLSDLTMAVDGLKQYWLHIALLPNEV